jgi:ubiquinone/menaquinone biosynthesis C-methylase UbiE
MDDSQQWWDDFWTKQDFSPQGAGDSDETWYDLVCLVGLEFWRDLFEEFAPGKKMLECGCGSAKVSQFMAHHGYQCALLDYSEKALQTGKNAFDSQSIEGSFYTGDINHLCFPDNSFDIVYSGGVLEFFDDVKKPVSEMVRVLKPGGVFAANMVPRKFSIQTVADFERTIVYSCRNLVRRQFGDVFRRVQYVPRHYKVNSLRLQDYTEICEVAGLQPITGLATSPFPDLALPKAGKQMYAWVMKKLRPQWRRFNLSKSRWTEIWGTTYTLYGIKK